jgi:hypothetical protein
MDVGFLNLVLDVVLGATGLGWFLLVTLVAVIAVKIYFIINAYLGLALWGPFYTVIQ